MMGSKSTVTASLPALVFACAMAVLSAQPAAAQGKQDLKCKGCVGSKDIANNGIKSGDIKDGQVKNRDLAGNAVDGAKVRDGSLGGVDIQDDSLTGADIQDGGLTGADIQDGGLTGADIQDGAVSFEKLAPAAQQRITDLEAIAQETLPFYVVLDGDGSQQVIGSSGSLELSARCRVNPGGSGIDSITLLIGSTDNEWYFVTNAGSSLPFDSFDVAVAFQLASMTTTARTLKTNSFLGAAIASDGSYLAIDGPTMVLGTNIFGHDCIAAGTAHFISGTL